MSNETNEPAITPCTICGKEVRVWFNDVPYCLDCYNRMMDHRTGMESPTIDSYRILALDAEGHAVEYGIERFSTGTKSIWTATEDVSDDDSRRSWGYVGRTVSTVADLLEEDESEAFDELMLKAQRLTAHASADAHPIRPGEYWPNTARRGNAVVNANETGVAHITCDDNGKHCVVVDGQQLTAEQFLDMLMCYEGFDMYWRMCDASDEIPDWL